jgi:hypothetical protein
MPKRAPPPLRRARRALPAALAASLLAACGGTEAGTPAPPPAACYAYRAPAAVGTPDPEVAVLEASDLERFLAVIEAHPAGDPDLVAALQSGYLDAGTPGLREFASLRICSAADLGRTVNAASAFYRSIGPPLRRLSGDPSVQAPIRAAFAALRSRYPATVLFPTYFTVGRFTTAGTIGRSGLLVAAEYLAAGPDTVTAGLAPAALRYLRPPEQAAPLVIHEQVHVQQALAGGLMSRAGRTLLEEALLEGGADFVGNLAAGDFINRWIHDWAAPREADLWREFATAMDGTDVSRWLYNQGTATADRPGDLGYYVGYRICEAYFDAAADKDRAVADIIGIRDAHAFLEASGYAARLGP